MRDAVLSFVNDPLYPVFQEKEADGDLGFILRNLLAVLNGDGGHYQGEHGIARATAYGIDRFYGLVGLRHEIAILQEKNTEWARLCDEWAKERGDLVAALEEISIGKGSFTLDPYDHAVNCITEMKALAEAALASVNP